MNLEDFIYKCFHTLSPARKLSKNWHINVIAEHLEGIQHNKRLIINIPPRCMKSTCVSVAWPAWILGHNPSSNIIVASYSKGLSIKHSLDTRCIMQSEWYKKIFPNTILSHEQNTKHKFQTTQRGFRLATSIGSTLTGEGADILIADDPITPMEANSIKYRRRVIDWFEQMFLTRLNCIKNGVAVIVMHRLHTEDLVSHLLTKKHFKWHCLSLQMIAEHSQNIYYNNQLLYRVNQGDILDKERFSAQDIALIKQDVGSYGFSSQYQQKPYLTSSGIIKKEYLNRYNSLTGIEYSVSQSWDTANTNSADSNYSVCITYTKLHSKFYIIDIFRGQLNYPDLKHKVQELARTYNAVEILIEEKASGVQILQDLGSNTGLPLLAIRPKTSKLNRLYQVLPLIEEKKILLPYTATWLKDFEEELITFPHSANSDQVDTLTQLLLHSKSNKSNNMNLRVI